MKIAVCGVDVSKLRNKVETHYGVESVNVKSADELSSIYKSARLTYDYDDVETVVFNGCVLDSAAYDKALHPLDEQIVLCALDNLDVVYVNVAGMSQEEIDSYHQFDEFCPGKVVDVVDVDTFVI
jgi:hypothetical protein